MKRLFQVALTVAVLVLLARSRARRGAGERPDEPEVIFDDPPAPDPPAAPDVPPDITPDITLDVAPDGTPSERYAG